MPAYGPDLVARERRLRSVVDQQAARILELEDERDALRKALAEVRHGNQFSHGVPEAELGQTRCRAIDAALGGGS